MTHHLSLVSRRLLELPVSGRRRAERPLPRWLPWTIVAATVVAAVLAFLLTRTTADTQDQNASLQGDKAVLTGQRDATAQQATTLADQVAQACSSGGITAEDLQRVGACQQAQQVHTDPIPGPRGERGPGPTVDEIRGAVAAYLTANPPPAGRAPTASEVAAAVTDYLVANPPQPGRAPTAAEIASAVSTYFATNPAPAGAKGDQGPAPTAEQIQTAVNQYLDDHPPAAGPAGPAGPVCPDGSSQQQVTYDDGRVGVGCVLDQQPAPMIPDGGVGG